MAARRVLGKAARAVIALRWGSVMCGRPPGDQGGARCCYGGDDGCWCRGSEKGNLKPNGGMMNGDRGGVWILLRCRGALPVQGQGSSVVIAPPKTPSNDRYGGTEE
jgi:hypothetical protein